MSSRQSAQGGHGTPETSAEGWLRCFHQTGPSADGLCLDPGSNHKHLMETERETDDKVSLKKNEKKLIDDNNRRSDVGFHDL